MGEERYMMTAAEVATELNVSKGHAYKLVRQLNKELHSQGFVVVAGKLPRPFWKKKIYGYGKEVA